jgi:hypothetical protein
MACHGERVGKRMLIEYPKVSTQNMQCTIANEVVVLGVL